MRFSKLFIFFFSSIIPFQGYSEIEEDKITKQTTNIYPVHLEEGTPLEIFSPKANTVFKRGNMVEVRWTGGNPNDEYALDLFDGKYHYRHIGELKNSGVYPWIIPKDVSPGKEYRFKLTNTNDFSEYSFGETFVIKRKVPVVAWIIPGGLVITGAVILLLQDRSSDEPNDLPIPIDP